MTSDNPAVFIIAPIGSQKSDFISELGNRYSKTFWFNAVTEDMSLYVHTLIDKILKDNPLLQFKLKQLLLCDLKYTGYDSIIFTILDYIDKMKEDVLIVFEQMEHMPQNFDYSDFVTLIKNAPSNLKIVFSSTEMLPFNWREFEPKYPMFVDNITFYQKKSTELDFYLEELSEEDISFLTKVVQIDAIDIDFLKKEYADGANILKRLSKKGEYVCTRDVNYFRISPALRDLLDSKYALRGEEIRDIKRKYGNHLRETGHYYGSLNLFRKANDLEGFNESVKIIIRDIGLLSKGHAYVAVHERLNIEINDENMQKYPYAVFYNILHAFAHEPKGRDLFQKIQDMGELFKKIDIRAYLVCELMNIYCLILAGETVKAREVFINLHKYQDIENQDFFFTLACMLPNITTNTDISIEDIESYTFSEGSEENLGYIRLMEEIAKAYFKQGNYRNALKVVRMIKEYLDYYVIPPYFLVPHYYSGEVKGAVELANETINWPKPLNKGLDVLYTIKAMTDLYYGNLSEASKHFDCAYKCLQEADDYYYFTITQRCLYKAYIGEAQYAKNLASIHMQIAKSKKKEPSNGLLLSLSYAYFKLGDKKTSYMYATECVKNSTSKSYVWLLGTGIMINIMLSQSDYIEAHTLIKNLLKASYFYGMKMIVVDFDDIFGQILSFAKNRNIEVEYVLQLTEDIKHKSNLTMKANPLKIYFFGPVSVMVGGEEIKWKTQKAKDLFVQLFFAGSDGVTRAEIIQSLWGDREYDSAINNLKTTNNIIRNTLKKHDIKYTLDYINAKYILKIDDVETDYNQYQQLSQKIGQEQSLQKGVVLINKILQIYKGDFAEDIVSERLIIERGIIKQWIIVNMFKLIKKLAKQEEFVEAKNLLKRLMQIDIETDYGSIMNTINSGYSEKLANIDL